MTARQWNRGSFGSAITIRIRMGLCLTLSALSGCGHSDAIAPAAVEATVPVNLDRHCDLAPYPSEPWTRCELDNFARTKEAIPEQATPAFVTALAQRSADSLRSWTARAAADPSWLSPLSGNTVALPVCAAGPPFCVGDPFRHPQAQGVDGAAFYSSGVEVEPVVFYDRECARLSGHLWVPRASTGPLPGIVITNGSFQAPEAAYWWAAQALVRGGYAVLTYDPRGQGRSDQQTPDAQQGSNLNAKVFWEGQVDAIDFFDSRPLQPYPHEARCRGAYPTQTDAYNPLWPRIDRDRLGIAGHSLGAIGVSVVQGYGANDQVEPWPGKFASENPVKAAVAWDSLVTPDLDGFAPFTNYPLPDWLIQVLGQIGTQGNLPRFAPRAPALSFNADYALAPVLYVEPPDAERHKRAYSAWQASGVPVMTLTFQGTTHLDYSLLPGFPATSWCPDPGTGTCAGGWGLPAITYYTMAWFDRWLKRAGEPGYSDADARLLDDAGPQGAAKMSFRYRSARDFPDRRGHRQLCQDIRSGCR